MILLILKYVFILTLKYLKLKFYLFTFYLFTFLFLFKTSKDQTIEELRVDYEVSEVTSITEQSSKPANLGYSVMSVLFEKKNQTVSTVEKDEFTK